MKVLWEQIDDSAKQRVYSGRVVESSHGIVERAKVPGGWFVTFHVGSSAGITFYPDPDHEWDGNSLP
jgi:hypothetical protein